jgi:hypothetical protein
MTSKEYLSQFPDSEITSSEFKLAQKSKDLTNFRNARNKKLREDWKDPVYREKMRKIQSDSMKRRLGVIDGK